AETEREELYPVKDHGKMAEDMIFLERSLLSEKQNLEDGTKEYIVFHPDFFSKFDGLADALSSARNYLSEDQVSHAGIYLNTSLLSINLLIKDLINLKEEIKKQMQQSNSEGMDDALNQMADAQQQLNEMTKRMQGQIGKEGLSQETQDYLDELSFQQEMIQKAVGSFIQNYQEAGKLLGDLGQAAKEMEEIKEKLRAKKIDQDLIQKQNKVLKRLLDSQKSLYAEDYSKERKADTAKEYKKQKPDELAREKIELRSKSRYHQNINKYPLEYKKLVDDYFKVLSIIEEEKE
ncbi:MAG: hypothetical protein PHF84_08535, partial [bacterium]|nr:hypothetical protein [bacterium]